MRKYLLNSAVIGSALGALNLAKATKAGPRDWRLALLWLAWGCSLALALGAVSQESDAKRQQAEHPESKPAKKQAKADEKAAKKRKISVSA